MCVRVWINVYECRCLWILEEGVGCIGVGVISVMSYFIGDYGF